MKYDSHVQLTITLELDREEAEIIEFCLQTLFKVLPPNKMTGYTVKGKQLLKELSAQLNETLERYGRHTENVEEDVEEEYIDYSKKDIPNYERENIKAKSKRKRT